MKTAIKILSAKKQAQLLFKKSPRTYKYWKEMLIAEMKKSNCLELEAAKNLCGKIRTENPKNMWLFGTAAVMLENRKKKYAWLKCLFRKHDVVKKICIRCDARFGVPRHRNPPPPPEKDLKTTWDKHGTRRKN